MKVAIPKEIIADEHRVAATPKTVAKMVKAGMSVAVESGAGLDSSITDEEFQQAGAEIAANAENLLKEADVVLKVQPPGLNESTGTHELELFKENCTALALAVAIPGRLDGRQGCIDQLAGRREFQQFESFHRFIAHQLPLNGRQFRADVGQIVKNFLGASQLILQFFESGLMKNFGGGPVVVVHFVKAFSTSKPPNWNFSLRFLFVSSSANC